jgi:uncharacterized protein
MLFVSIGIDKADGATLRSAKVSEHLDYLHGTGAVKVAGPFTNDKGAMIGSLLIIEAANKAAAEAWVANEPFTKAGLFARSELYPWFTVMNSLDRA